MANEQNLRPFTTSEAAREGQKKAVKSRKRNQKKHETMAETVRTVLDTPVTDPKQLALIAKAGLPVPDNPTYRDLVVASIVYRTAGKGKVDDIQKLMEILGEQPPEQKDKSQTAALKSIVNAIKVEDDEDYKAEPEAEGDT